MRIESTRGGSPVSKSDKAKKSSGTGGAFGAFMADDTPSAQGAAPSMGAGNIGSLLAAQYEDEDVLEKRRQKNMVRRATLTLDALDDVKRGLVSGSITVADMNRLKNSLASKREGVMDPKLIAIMDEVEMRAQIELAKLEIAAEKQGKN